MRAMADIRLSFPGFAGFCGSKVTSRFEGEIVSIHFGAKWRRKDQRLRKEMVRYEY